MKIDDLKIRAESLDKVREFITEFKEDLEPMEELKDWDTVPEVFLNLKRIISMMRDVALMYIYITDITGELISSGDMKAATKKTIDDLIKLPLYLEWVDNIIIDGLVDGAFAFAQQLNGMPDDRAVELRRKVSAKIAGI